MKRIIIIMLMALSINLNLFAQQRQQVTRDEAISAALTRLTDSNIHTESNIRGLTLIEKNDSAGNTVLYEVSTDSVSLLLSGSKACYPVLAKYQTYNGPLLSRYDNLPANLRSFLDGYIQQISFCFSNDTIRLYHHGIWDSLIGGNCPERRNYVSVGPLISTKWGQKGCNEGSSVGYEYYMPGTTGCDHCVAGCVAVAMGQVMNYWKQPLPTKWYYLFDWCNMSDLLDDDSPTFFQNRNAISELLRDCGDKVNMRYGCTGSGAYFDAIKTVLVNNYGYSNNANYIARAGMSDGDWMNLLRQQIDANMPVLYCGNGSGSHAFICDGYGDSIYFHFNWGASGQDDGSYLIGCLNPFFNGAQHNFSNDHMALINIYPIDNTILCNRDVVLDDYYSLYQDVITNGTYHPSELLPVTVTNLISASTNADQSWRTIPAGATTTYQAQESITLRDGFTVERGADFAAIIEPCDNCGNPPLRLFRQMRR